MRPEAAPEAAEQVEHDSVQGKLSPLPSGTGELERAAFFESRACREKCEPKPSLRSFQ